MTAAYFKQTYYVLHPKLYRVAFAFLQNAEDAEDILQDAYCKLWDERHKLVDIQKPEAYCVTLVKHLCMDFFRSLKPAVYDFEDYEIPDQTLNVQTVMEHKETIERINTIIRHLPEKQQRVLDLCAFAGCTHEEIERVTGESPVNVRALLSRARNTLKMKLKQYSYD